MLRPSFTEWLCETPLTSGANVIVPLGAGGGGVVGSGRSCTFITWGVISSHTFDFIVEGCVNSGFVNIENLVTQACLAGVHYTPYQLAAPMTGGYVVLTRPMVRIRLVDTATSNHTYMRLYAKGWWA